MVLKFFPDISRSICPYLCSLAITEQNIHFLINSISILKIYCNRSRKPSCIGRGQWLNDSQINTSKFLMTSLRRVTQNTGRNFPLFELWMLHNWKLFIYMYVSFKTFFCVVRHLDSTASYLPSSLHLGSFRAWPSLFLLSSFSSIFLVLSFVLASISMLFWAVFLLTFFKHGRTMWAVRSNIQRNVCI